MSPVFVALLLLLWTTRVAWLLRARRARPSAAPVRTLAVLGSGGHTAEMIQLLQALDRTKFGPMLYVLADTDTTSANRIAAFERDVAARRQPMGDWPPAYRLLRVRRSREVGQSYASSALTTLHALAHSVARVFAARPALVLCNGPGTCVPIAVAALLLRLLAGVPKAPGLGDAAGSPQASQHGPRVWLRATLRTRHAP